MSSRSYRVPRMDPAGAGRRARCGLSAWNGAAARLLLFVLLPGTMVASGAPSATAAQPATPDWAPDGPGSFEECTITVVGAAASADGRPLLFKNRDSGYVDNEVVYFEDGVHPYVTLVSAGETANAWIGVNQAGFAIMNALSYNIPDSLWGGITNGQLMKLALQTCATVSDFENLLWQTARGTGRDNPANLGVIDARGGAAMFEVGSRHHRRFDAGNPQHAPKGYLARANFSLSWDTTAVETWRYRRASALLGRAVERGGVRRVDALEMLRDLHSAYVDPYPLPCEQAPPGWPGAIGYIDTYETINRVSTVASGLVAGVRPDEPAGLSVFYAALGQPVVAPYVPVWVDGGPTPSQLDGPQTAPFCDLARARADDVYDYPASWRLLNSRKLVEATGSRTVNLVLVRAIERRAHASVDSLLQIWRTTGISPDGAAAAQAKICATMFRHFKGAGGSEARPLTGPVAVTPNPARAEVWFTSPSGGPLELFDLAGRRLAVLREESGGVGSYLWDRRDASGARLPAGIYFCRPVGDAGPAARLVLLP